MNTLLGVTALIILAAAPVPISLLIEAVRRAPEAPSTLYWAPNVPIRYVTVNGISIRYIRTGSGPALLLLHTIRTQFDLFHKLIPDLSRDFTVIALDYPGHGFSDLPEVEYRPELFVTTVEQFLEQLDIREATVAGISIGGIIPLLLAAKRNPRVRKVVAINPYDYAKGRGIRRGNFVAWLIMGCALIPVLGETFVRFRIRLIEKWVFEGGITDASALAPELMDLLYAAGLRRDHYRRFINLLRNAHHWEEAHREYGRIQSPVLVVYGERDWSNGTERKRTVGEIPGARLETVRGGGHFLALDRPMELATLIRGFARQGGT